MKQNTTNKEHEMLKTNKRKHYEPNDKEKREALNIRR